MMVEPGIHHDIPFAEYLQWPYWNQSALKQAMNSMAHVRNAMDGDRTPTDDMNLGSALHTAFLEPDELDSRVIEWTGSARRGKEWESFREDHADKVILTEGYYANLLGMVDAMRRHPFVQRWSDRIEAVEVSFVGEVDGLMCKGRIDALTDDPLVDIKKVASADKRLVTNTVMNLGYHIQGALYRRLTGRDDFVILCVEGTAPFDVVPYRMRPDLLALGDAQLDWIIPAVKTCEESGRWPGRHEFDCADELEPPSWAIPNHDLEVTFGEERVA